MELLFSALQLLRGLWSKIGLYALIEIALPGGTPLTLILYAYRRSRAGPRKPIVTKESDRRNSMETDRRYIDGRYIASWFCPSLPARKSAAGMKGIIR